MTIAVYSAKGGVGTTSIAINLAYALARNDPSARVALADLVVAGGDIRVLLDLKPAYDMGDLVKKVDRLDADLLHSLLTPTAGGVWALPASDDPELAEALDAQATAAIVGQLKAHFAFTVLDCEHHISERTLTALDVADRIVLVTQLNVAAIRSTQRTLALCQRLGYPADKLCVVVNRFSPGDIISPADAASLLQHEIFARIPNDYRTAVAAITKGVPVAVQSATSQLAASYTNLAVKLGGSPAEGDTASNGHAPASRLGRLLKLGRK
jgi:pilus assembly protein CpaE